MAAILLLAGLPVVAAPVAGTTGPAVSPAAYVGLSDPATGCAGMVPINTAVPSSPTGPAPSLCWFNGSLYAAFTTAGSGISWAVNNGSGWSAPKPAG